MSAAGASAPRPAAAPLAGSIRRSIEWMGELAILVGQALGQIARGRAPVRETITQMAYLGVQSLPITMMTIGFSGMVMALHTANQLKRMGADGLIGGLVAVSMAREAAPILTAVVVAARAGSSMAAEIGTMVVTEQVDALRSLGVSPVRYLVAPRLLAMLVMLPVLTVFGNLAGVAGGYIVSVFGAGIRSATYLQSAQELTTPDDVLLGLAKTIVFAVILAGVGCTQGLRTQGGAAGVGRATTGAVVASIVIVYVANYFLAEWMFGDRAIRYS